MDCFNKGCPFRVNETSNPHRCERTACPNRCGYGRVIASDHTLLDEELREELARVTAEKYTAVETIFKYAGCQECKWWDDKDGFCKKQGRNAVLYDWLCSPVWRGTKEE